MQARLALIGAATLAAVALAACGTTTESATVTESGTVSPVATTSATAAEAASEPHNNADVMFANHMIPHHEQAVEMSDIVLGKQGVNAQVTDLATRIKDAQAPEIELMRSWLLEWGAPTGMPGHDMGDMPGMGDMDMGDMGMDGMGMAGMLSQADLDALRAADGKQASKLYVTGMIEHHRGAIDMAQHEIDNGQSPAAVALAKTIITTQQAEIDEMTALLPSL